MSVCEHRAARVNLVTETAPPPQRIQRRREKGQRLPEGTIYVGRPTKWGNPFRVGTNVDRGECLTAADAVRNYEHWMRHPEEWVLPRPPEIRSLRGKDLACWCPLVDGHGQRVPCHADVLLALANAR